MTTSDQERAAPAQQPVAFGWLKPLDDARNAHIIVGRMKQTSARDEALQSLDRVVSALESASPAHSEPELRAEIVRLTQQGDRFCDKYLAALKRAEVAESRVEALSAEVGKLTEALERIDALDEASGHEMAVRHAFEAVGIARTALGEAK